LPKDTPDFTPGPVVQRYLADYADHFDVTPHLRFDSTVVDMARHDDGWTVVSRQGEDERRDEFDLVGSWSS
jgi:dimethylaniline monooxygenase (N-oxide forming)